MPRCAASTDKARPIPEPAPVISTYFCSRGMAQLRASAKVVKDRAVQPVEDRRMVDDDALGVLIIETIDQLSEESDVFGIQRSMGSKIGKSGIALQTERRLHRVGDLVSQQDRYPLENMDAAEECVRADMLDGVVRVTHHDPAGRPGLAGADRVRIAAKR